MTPREGAPPGGIDFGRSRAILLGTSEYRDRQLPRLPAARNSLDAMYRMLTGPACGWPGDRVHKFADRRARDSLRLDLGDLIHSAEHTLLFYYVGHGQLVDGGNDLGLALVDTESDAAKRRRTSLLWSDLRAEIDASPSSTRILLFDCCFSGRTTRPTMGTATLAEQVGRTVDTEGVFTLAASRHNEEAVYSRGRDGVTYFAKFFTEIVQDGVPRSPDEWLTLLDIYEELRRRFVDLDDPDVREPPRPTQQIVGDAHRLAFARNAAVSAPVPGPGGGSGSGGAGGSGTYGLPARGRTRRNALGVGGLLAVGGVAAWLLDHRSDAPGPDRPGAAGSGGSSPAASGTGASSGSTVRPAGSGGPGPSGATSSGAASPGTAKAITRATSVGTPLRGHTGWVRCVAFDPAQPGILASASKDTTIRLWDIGDPAHAKQWGEAVKGHGDTVGALAFRPSGHVLASCGDKGVQLWDTASPANPRPIGAVLNGHADAVFSVAFSPDGAVMASAGADRTIVLWDTTDPGYAGPLAQPLYGHANAVSSAAFSPHGHLLASGGFDKTVRLWDVTDPRHPSELGRPLLGHTNSILSVAFSADGRTLASCGLDGTVRLWDVTHRGAAKAAGAPIASHVQEVESVAFSPLGILASGSADLTIQLDDIRRPSRPRAVGFPLTGFQGTVLSVAFGDDGTLLAGSGVDESIRLWRLS